MSTVTLTVCAEAYDEHAVVEARRVAQEPRRVRHASHVELTGQARQ